jgi:hypothetical protein
VLRVGLVLVVIPLFAACQGETVGEQGATGGGTSGSGGTGALGTGATAAGASGGSTGTGPGPHGALPSGYCCTSNEQCRYRTCAEFGGVKMCADECWGDNGACNTAPNMVCNTTSEHCEPSGPPTCIPADQYTLGASAIGSCCVATGDGHAGEECEGNRCEAFGDVSNPFICTQPCDAPKDCPPKYECNHWTHSCWPLATTYGCQ